jgi:arylsulfatase A-like enzyme
MWARGPSGVREREPVVLWSRGVLLLLAGLLPPVLLACEPEEPPPPNILFIAIDDLNDWVGHLGGHPDAHTPHIDRLAEQGVAFTMAHVPAVSCTPSRTSILTGLSPASTGIYGNVDFYWRDLPHLRDVVTLPQLFRENGYRTVGGGKMFHALSWIDRSYGQNQNDPASWDDYFPSLDKPMPDEVWPSPADTTESGARVWEPAAQGEGERVPPWFFDWAPLDIPDSEMSDHQVVDWAIGELEQEVADPFFLAVGIYRPHIPWFVPREYFEMYPLEEVVIPELPEAPLAGLPEPGVAMGAGRRSWHRWVAENDLWEEAVQAYLASVTFADVQVGRLLDALEASPHAGNTVIVLWSDHGFHLGEKETWEKFTLWEESTRVPFIIVAPGVTPAGERSHQPVDLLDIYRTLAELAGLEVDATVEGESLVPLLREPHLETGRAVVTTIDGGGGQSVRSTRWRYIRFTDGSEILYDHEADPGEHRNLAEDPTYREVMDELAGWLASEMRPAVRPPGLD